MICNIFSHSVGCLQAIASRINTLLVLPLEALNSSLFMKSDLLVFSFVACAFGFRAKKRCQIQCHKLWAYVFF